MPKRIPRLVRTEDTRRRLLEAARRVFLKRGWAATSLEMIVREAGLTKGAVYSRFRSKADLFLALLEERIAQRIADVQTVAVGEHGPVGLAAAMGRRWDDDMPAELAWHRVGIEFRLHASRVPALNRRYAALHARLRHAIAAIIERETSEAGEPLAIPADDLARASMALLTGMVLERCADGDAYPEYLNETINRAVMLGLPAAAAPRLRRAAR